VNDEVDGLEPARHAASAGCIEAVVNAMNSVVQCRKDGKFAQLHDFLSDCPKLVSRLLSAGCNAINSLVFGYDVPSSMPPSDVSLDSIPDVRPRATRAVRLGIVPLIAHHMDTLHIDEWDAEVCLAALRAIANPSYVHFKHPSDLRRHASVLDAFDAIERAGKKFRKRRRIAEHIEAIRSNFVCDGVLDLSEVGKLDPADPPLIEELSTRIHD